MYIKNGKRHFHFGLSQRTVLYGSVFPIYADKIEVIPDPFWYSFSLRKYLFKVLDQGNQNSCVGAVTVGALMLARKQYGFEDIELSIASIYGQINCGMDNGAQLSSALLAAHRYGACPVNVIPHEQWQCNEWPKNWQDIAKCYRILEAYDCTSFQEIVSAILDGFPVCLGVNLSRNDVLDVGKDGFLPINSSGHYAHALLGIGVKRYKNLWWIEAASSWGVNWANEGICYIPEYKFHNTLLDAWALRVTTYCQENYNVASRTTSNATK